MNFDFFPYEHLAKEPLFFLFIAFSALLGYGFFWGKRINHRLFMSAFADLISVVKPVDQTFTNIGGLIGYHATLTPPKEDPIAQVDATITFLPRHSWLWMPISMLIRKYDRLFITIHFRRALIAEGHLIEKGYAGFRGPKITNAERLQQENIKWGAYDFILYFGNETIRQKLRQILNRQADPGTVRHIAVVPEQQKGFIFMIPKKGNVATCLSPIYQWLPSLLKQEGKGK